MKRRDLEYVLFALIRLAFVIYWCFQKRYDIAHNHIGLMEEGHENFLKSCDKEENS